MTRGAQKNLRMRVTGMRVIWMRVAWMPLWIGLAAIAFFCPIGRCADDAASSRPSETSAALQRQLRAIDARADGIQSLAGDFRQEKFTALLDQPLVSSGTIRAAGAVARWDTKVPEASSLLINDRELCLYYPDQKLEEIYPIDARLADLIASPLPRLATVEKHFSIAPADADDLGDLQQFLADAKKTGTDVLAMRLTPTDPALQTHVQKAVVLIDAKTALGIAMETMDADGDRTVMSFSQIRINPGISAAELELKVPPGTTISHPLRGLSGTQGNQ